MSKTLALALVLVFLTASTIITFLPVKAETKTIIVPDDYPTISGAIANATDGDTIYVRNGTYRENAINTEKSLSIIGEGYESTIINFTSRGHEVVVSILEKYYFYDPAITVNANDFTLSGLTINSNGGDISITGNQTQISDSKITTVFQASGYYLNVASNSFSKDTAIIGNYSEITKNSFQDKRGGNGISFGGQYSIISNNNLSGSNVYVSTTSSLISRNEFDGGASFILKGADNIIANNLINHASLQVSGSNNTILKNTITHATEGLFPGLGNICYANNIANNYWGIDVLNTNFFPSAITTIIFHNNFEKNTYQVSSMGKDNNGNYGKYNFDNGQEGNYWSDYVGLDKNGDGIGDTPYIIDSNRSDRYPLIAPFNISNVPDLIPQWALPPSIEIISPINKNYANGNITINFSINKNPTWIGYSLDGQSNITINSNLTLTNLSTGIHKITIYANDEYRNTGNSTSITFEVQKPLIENLGSPIMVVIIIVSIAIVCVVIGLLFFRKHRKKA
jgi:nitrous oxidase accessory protein NosD